MGATNHTGRRRKSNVRSGAPKPSHSLVRRSSPNWEKSSSIAPARKETSHDNGSVIGYDSDTKAGTVGGDTGEVDLEG